MLRTMAEPEKVEAEVEAPEGPASGSAKVGHVTGKSCFCGRGAFALIFHAVLFQAPIY